MPRTHRQIHSSPPRRLIAHAQLPLTTRGQRWQATTTLRHASFDRFPTLFKRPSSAFVRIRLVPCRSTSVARSRPRSQPCSCSRPNARRAGSGSLDYSPTPYRDSGATLTQPPPAVASHLHQHADRADTQVLGLPLSSPSSYVQIVTQHILQPMYVHFLRLPDLLPSASSPANTPYAGVGCTYTRARSRMADATEPR